MRGSLSSKRLMLFFMFSCFEKSHYLGKSNSAHYTGITFCGEFLQFLYLLYLVKHNVEFAEIHFHNFFDQNSAKSTDLALTNSFHVILLR